ncbi:MAG: hypothetical protein C5B55_05135 [Blastocatellia bacterium]|nr:MAG: hypothetical protein C5B55_05135 [Blastocatellia bacterium]
MECWALSPKNLTIFEHFTLSNLLSSITIDDCLLNKGHQMQLVLQILFGNGRARLPGTAIPKVSKRRVDLHIFL